MSASAELLSAERPLVAPVRARSDVGLWTTVQHRLQKDGFTAAALATLGVLGALAAGADILAGHVFRTGPTEQHLLRAFARPDPFSPALWLGTDELGRSQVVRLLYAARVSLGVATSAGLLNLAVGVPVGLVAGYARGGVDDLAQGLVATVHAIPRLFLLLLVAVVFGPSPLLLVVVLGLLAWPQVALFVRGQTLVLSQREFVVAARMLGASNVRILIRHVLPNVLPLVVVLTAIDVGGLILAESSLSFLGLGIQPPTPSWGNLLTNAANSLTRGPWLVYGPGTAIFLTVLCLYVVGDGVRDALDPRQRR